MELVRFRIDLAPRCSLGPGKIALLEAIDSAGSLTKAAASLGMSYRYGWLLLDDMKRSFTEPVTRATVGGARGGGVRLTKFGGEVVRRYHAARRSIDSAARRALGPLLGKAVKRRAAPNKRARSIKRAALSTAGAGTRR